MGDQRYEETEQQIRRIGRQKAADGKIVAVHREKLWNMVQIEKGRRRRAQKKIGRPTWKPGPNQPWKSIVISNKKYHGNK